MLVLSMKKGDKIDIGDNITVCFVKKKSRGQIAIGFEAPKEINIVRHNAIIKIRKENDNE